LLTHRCGHVTATQIIDVIERRNCYENHSSEFVWVV